MDGPFHAKHQYITDKPYRFTELVIIAIVFYAEKTGVFTNADLAGFR